MSAPPVIRIYMRRNSDSDEWQKGPQVFSMQDARKLCNKVNAALGWTKYRVEAVHR